ncbi:hypothetical protein MKX03_017835 [Papaver bracteatum]|nr:hypothetical protein MKX03_017835 [Papaver bracteatum]
MLTSRTLAKPPSVFLRMFEWQYQNDQKHVHPKISGRPKHCIRPLSMLVTENKQPFGKEAKKELTKLVKGNCVSVHVYEEDQYGRLVGDVYCNGTFAQEVMLKKGLAWHYAAFDKPAGIGLWADSDPEKPWEWRKITPERKLVYLRDSTCHHKSSKSSFY